MSAVPVSPILHSLSDTGGTADSGSPTILAKNSVDHSETRSSRNKPAVRTPPPRTRWRHLAGAFSVSLILLSATPFGRCTTDVSAPPSQPASGASSPVPSAPALSPTPPKDDVARGSSSVVRSSVEQAQKDQPESQLDSDSGKDLVGLQQDSAQARLQHTVLPEKAKPRSPPLLHIHRAFSLFTDDTTSATSDTKSVNAAHTRSHLNAAEPEVKRLGAQTRPKQTTTTRATVQEANVLPLRTYTYGNIHQTAYYFADVIIGTPPVQRQSLILDTGSSVVGFPCTTCKSCGAHIDPPFDCAASSTCKRLQCTTSCTHCDSKQRRCAYRVSYMEGSSLQGFWHEDYIHVLKPPRIIVKNSERVYDIKTQMTQARKSMQFRPSSTFLPSTLLSPPTVTNFGCHMEETALFVNQKASGIWGLEIWSQFGPPTYMTRTLLGSTLAPPQLQGSSSSSRSNPSSLSVSAPPISASPVFALCLAEHGGAFAIGETHKELHTSKLVKTRFIPDQESYSVYISAIVVGDENIALYQPKIPAASTKLPPAFVSASFETLHPLATSATSRSPGTDTHFEVLLDSGTTMSYFPTDVYTRIITAIEKYAEQQNENLSSKTRRLGANVRESERGKASTADRRNKGRLFPLYVANDELEVGAVDSARDAAKYPTADAQERRLAVLRGEKQTVQTTLNDDVEEESEDLTEIVRNPTATQLVQHSRMKDAGWRRAVPGEAGESVPQRRPSKSHPSSQATPEGAEEFPAVREASQANLQGPGEFPAVRNVSLIGKKGRENLDRPQVASRNQQIQEFESQPAPPTQKVHTSTLVNGSSLRKKGTTAKMVEQEGSQYSSIIVVRSGRAARGSARKTLVNSSYVPSRTKMGTGKETFGALRSNVYTAFPSWRRRFNDIWEKLQRRRKARLVAFGEELRDSEAEIIGDMLTSHHVDDEEAYTLLPQSASPRQSQAVKVESAEGELCFYLPKGRPDLKYFPDIWIKFVQTPPHRHTSTPVTGRRKEDNYAEAEDAAAERVNAGEGESIMRDPSEGWLRWAPASYLYTKGNDHYRCIAVSDDPNSDTTGVLGSSFFIGHDVIFDIGNHTVAFAEASCPRIRLKDRPRDLPL